MMTAYDLAYAIAIGATAPVWLMAPGLRRKVLDALRARNGNVPRSTSNEPGVLIHAVSMGEINATPALVSLLAFTIPDLRFIISTTSRTGEARARQLYAKEPRVTLIRFPFDFSKSVGKMLDAQRPSVVVLMELEVWPNFTHECEKRRIPVILVNGRLSAYSYRGYRLTGPFTRPMFSRLTLACVQEEAYVARFKRVGVPADRIRVTGTMKFDTAQLADPKADAIAIGQSVGLHPGEEKIWVCGSTGPGEEQIVLSAYAELRKTFPSLRLVIVPRDLERFDEVANLIKSQGFALVRRSQPDVPPAPVGRPIVVLGDTMGELRKFYSVADIVFVGRTLVDLGSKQHGSDMIEPAALAKPVIVGPYTGNFMEAMNRFREARAIREIHQPQQLAGAVAELMLAPIACAEIGQNAQYVVRQNQARRPGMPKPSLTTWPCGRQRNRRTRTTKRRPMRRRSRNIRVQRWTAAMRRNAPVPSPLYAGERVRVRGRSASCAGSPRRPSPQPSPPSTGAREPDREPPQSSVGDRNILGSPLAASHLAGSMNPESATTKTRLGSDKRHIASPASRVIRELFREARRTRIDGLFRNPYHHLTYRPPVENANPGSRRALRGMIPRRQEPGSACLPLSAIFTVIWKRSPRSSTRSTGAAFSILSAWAISWVWAQSP